MHHEVGYGAETNAWIIIKWCWFWLVVFGIPCALAMYLPSWVKTPEPLVEEVHHHPVVPVDRDT